MALAGAGAALAWANLSLVAAPAPAPAALTPEAAAFDAAPSDEDQPLLVPAPRQAQFPRGSLGLRDARIRVAGEGARLQEAARVVQAEVARRFGFELPVTTSPDGRRGPEIVIGTREHPDLAARIKASGLEADRPEGYALVVDEQGAWVAGADEAGAYWGAQTLRQLLVRSQQGPALRFARIADWPAFAFRGAMIYLDAFSRPINDRLLEMLAAYKFNAVLVMADYVKWESTRDIWHPLGASKDEARRVAALARQLGLEPIPLIELLGHAQWLFYGGKNRDLLHDPACPEPFAYDPLNPRTYEVVLPVLDEAVEAFGARWVHIGHDEVRSVCRFPATDEARAVGFDRLFVQDVLRLYRHLKARGVGVMMWQDAAFSDAAPEIVPQLPKDIVITDWHYLPGDDFVSVRQIRQAGFRVIGATWSQPGNAESFARSALQDGAMGMIQTRWTGQWGNRTVLDGNAEQAVAYVRAAASFWNPDAPVPDDVATRLYADAWAPAPYRPIRGHLVDLSPFATRSLVDPDGSGWLGKGPEYDWSALVAGRGAQAAGAAGQAQPKGRTVKLGPYRFDLSGAVMVRTERGAARQLPEAVTIPLHARAAAVAVLHTLGWGAPGPGQLVGSYVLRYEDGSRLTVPLRYGREIAAWTDLPVESLRRYPAWRGKTAGGLEVGADVLVIPNPYPSRTIASLTVEGASRWTSPAVLGMTLLDEVPPLPPTGAGAAGGEGSVREP